MKITARIVVAALIAFAAVAARSQKPELVVEPGHTREIWSISVSPDGRTLAAASEDNTIKIWDVASGQMLRALTGHKDWVYSVAFSPDGRTLASGAGYQNSPTISHDNTIKLWDLASGHELRTLAGHSEPVTCVRFSPDGRTLASASMDLTVKLWDVPSGQLLRTFTGHGDVVHFVAFSPDGRFLIAPSSGGLVTWPPDRGGAIRVFRVKR